jgi:hypothetical protein
VSASRINLRNILDVLKRQRTGASTATAVAITLRVDAFSAFEAFVLLSP